MARFRQRSTPLNTFKPSARQVPTGKFVLAIEGLADDGRGIARVDGKTVFVKNALPGETVNAVYQRCHKNYNEAETVTVLQPSDNRIEPACEYFGSCGGCALQHLAYPQQLLFKQEKIQRQLDKRVLGLSKLNEEPITSAPFAYRHRARFSVAAGKQGVSLGFKQAASHRIVPIVSCKLLQSAIDQAIGTVTALVTELKGRSLLEQVSMVEAADQRLALWIEVKRSLAEADLARLSAAAERYGWTIWASVTDERQNGWQWCSTTPVPALRYGFSGENIHLDYLPSDFTQVNPGVNDALVERALDWLALMPDDQVLDCFCGIGNFSLPLAKRAGRVTGIEISAEMVARAARNAADNGVENVHFLAADLMAESPVISGRYDKALLDPPRAGAAAVCRQIAGWGVQQLVYVSCNPSTFFRDAEILSEQGYVLERLALADMFPQTTHIELVSLFRKVNTEKRPL